MAETLAAAALSERTSPYGTPSPHKDKFRPPLAEYFQTLTRALGPQDWWPAKTPFEVIVGAILTQSTSWANVEKAIINLRKNHLVSARALETVSLARLARLIRPAGYFRQKAKKLKAFVRFLRREFGGSLRRMFKTPTAKLREKLLAVYGIGPETADSILLYAGGHPVFVIDAYTKRILMRHGWADDAAAYDDLQKLFVDSLPRDSRLFNEFHALLVQTGKNWCRKNAPRCEDCPLASFLEEGR